MKGLYVHIPFCRSKCPYCDFYSMRLDENTADTYLDAVLDEIENGKRTGGYTKNAELTFDTVYFGGGTPSVFGGERLGKILNAARKHYHIAPDAEMTVECNPSSADDAFFSSLASFGINRVSLGMQSAVDTERRMLGRQADKNAVAKAVDGAKKSGIQNISLDLMLGVPNQTMESLDESLDFLICIGITHISAYMLTLEENTVFYKRLHQLNLPNEDTVCEMYLHAVERLEAAGFYQYEISNFAKNGFESRHNLKYWNCEEYLGIGPSAHSFIDGKRFFFERSINDFIDGKPAEFDSFGGDKEEYIMLKLRLARGLDFSEYEKRFGEPLPEKIISKARFFERNGLVHCGKDRIALTKKGFLLSNSVIAELI